MGKSEWSFKTRDGLELQAVTWFPAERPIGLVCMIHGLGEHIGRYEAEAAALNSVGYVYAGFDLRGFGRSEGRRGHTPSLDAYFEDIDCFLAEVSKRWPIKRKFLHGMSMGGMLVLAYTLVRKPAITGVISSSPALKTAVERQRGKRLAVKILGTVCPTLSLANGLDPRELSREPRVNEIFEKDPLTYHRMTLGLGKAVLHGMRLAHGKASSFPLPLLVMIGSADRICFPEGSEAFVKAAPKDRTTLAVFEGFKHDLQHEFEKERVFATMIEWMDKLPG